MALLIISIMVTPCLAVKSGQWKTLSDAAGTDMTSYALTSGSAVYSETIDVKKNVGFSTILIKEDKAGGAGDVDVSVEYCLFSCSESENWHTAYTTNMKGTITAEGNIVTALQNVARYIPHVVRLASFMRYKFDPDANSQISVYHIYQKEN